MRIAGAAIMTAVTALPARAGCDPVALTTEVIAGGLASPTFVTTAPGDGQRLFVTERPGLIRVVLDGTLLAAPFLNLKAKVNDQIAEGALSGLAFHPQYQTNGRFYVTYTDLAGDSVLSRFQVSADPNVALVAETIVLTVPQPGGTHNVGWLAFGPDGLLYVGSGDGGNSTDGAFAQDPGSLLGKILRLDVDGAEPYAIPTGNPYARGGGLGEVWALGLRNPWRCSFDAVTGDLWIGDVGQASREEINRLAAPRPDGANFGWNCLEGTLCTGQGTGCTCGDPELIAPLHDYDHLTGCAVIGGHVYRGSALPFLEGLYVFGDLCNGRVWSLDPVTGDRTELLAFLPFLFSFGLDHQGELLVTTANDVRRITFFDCNTNGIPDETDLSDGTSLDCNTNGVPDECEGDCNRNGVPDDCDLADGADDINGNGVPDECESIADLDDDGVVGVSDFLILLAQWGPCDGGVAACPGDINNDGAVDTIDLLLLLARWTL